MGGAAKHGFVLTQDIEAPPRTVLEVLSELHGFSALHPFIVSIESLPPREERPAARFYRVLDLIPVGPLRLRTTYVAALEVVSDTEVVGDAWQRPGVVLHTNYALAPTATGTRLTERAQIEAPFGLRGFVTRQAQKAHAELLERLARHLAASSSGS